MSQHASAHAARSHKLRNTLFVIAALLILLVIAGGVVGLNFYKQAKEVKAHEEQAVSSLSAITDVNTLKDAQRRMPRSSRRGPIPPRQEILPMEHREHAVEDASCGR